MTEHLTVLAKGTLVWAAPVVGDGNYAWRIVDREGPLWVVYCPVMRRDYRDSFTGWYWCTSVATGFRYDFHADDLTACPPNYPHLDDINYEGQPDQ